ncbi:MAG: hypothetical protein FWC89_11045 [Defluviitaleaceae bacterium]|nr:hypothetical protein [Defluviitaleaceae bacterium]
MDNFPNYQKALRFSDGDYKTRLEEYNKQIGNRLKKEQYDDLIERKIRASSEWEYEKLAEQFREMTTYSNAVELAQQCDDLRHNLIKKREADEKEELYSKLIQRKSETFHEKDFSKLAEDFRKMNGYKDTIELANLCDEQRLKIKSEREEREAKEATAERLRTRIRTICLIVAGLFMVVAMVATYMSLIEPYMHTMHTFDIVLMVAFVIAPMVISFLVLLCTCPHEHNVRRFVLGIFFAIAPVGLLFLGIFAGYGTPLLVLGLACFIVACVISMIYPIRE